PVFLRGFPVFLRGIFFLHRFRACLPGVLLPFDRALSLTFRFEPALITDVILVETHRAKGDDRNHGYRHPRHDHTSPIALTPRSFARLLRFLVGPERGFLL